MNAPVETTALEVAQIEEALDCLLKAAIEAPRPDVDRPLKGAWADELIRTFEARMNMTPVQRLTADLLDDPVGQSLRASIRLLGKRLHEIGGLQLMQDVCDRVADHDDRNWSRRTDIMDKRWDGIGRTDKSPGWCS